MDEEEPLDEMCNVKLSGSPCVAAVDGEMDKQGRVREVLKALNIDEVELPQVELSKLHDLVQQFDSLFALNALELGRTTIVEHTTATGDHPPIRQLPRRIPFALRAKVCQLIEEMMQ